MMATPEIQDAVRWLSINRSFVSLILVCAVVLVATASAAWWTSQVVHGLTRIEYKMDQLLSRP